jgi:hypothetical protein
VPERPPLDLGDIMAQYDLFSPVRPEPPVLPGEDRQDALCFTVPTRLGKGPLKWSTCTALVPVVRVCHDVNGYYRDLGVEWTATRRELGQAYMDLGGPESIRLTYVIKQLLNPRVREAYDRTAAGEVFLDDYTDPEKKLKRQAREESARRLMRGESSSAQEVLDEWGYMLLDEEGLDNVSPLVNDRPQPEQPWGYSYYAWKTGSYLPHGGIFLRKWQELLSAAASRHGAHPEMILGTTSLSDQPFMMEDVNDSTVVFFSEDCAPSEQIADDVIGQLLHSSSR